MPAPLNPSLVDHAIDLYLAGESLAKIKALTGVGSTVLHRKRASRGIPPRRVKELPVSDIAAAYQAGESEYALSQRYGVSRNVIRRRLEQQGVPIRDMSAAGKVRARRMTPDERIAQARAAHDAVRGVRHTEEQLLARAAGREARGLCDSPGELFLMGELRRRGVQPIPQKAIGKYNVDFAIPPVAVEVLGGGWHYTKRHHSERTPHILNQGWCLLFIWNHEGKGALSGEAADYVVAYLNETRRDPSLIGEYRVIGGRGQFLAAGRAEDDKFPLVPPPRGS